jgi:hypothetical protein
MDFWTFEEGVSQRRNGNKILFKITRKFFFEKIGNN